MDTDVRIQPRLRYHGAGLYEVKNHEYVPALVTI